VRIAYAIESPLRYGGGVSVLVATLMEAFFGDHEIILISPDRKEDLLHDAVGSRCKKHIRWLCEKNPPSREFYEISSKTLVQVIQAKPDLVHFHSGGVFSWGNRWPGASWPAYLKKHNIASIWTNHSVVNLLHGYCGDQKPLWFKLAMLPLSYVAKSQQMAATLQEICVSDHDSAKIKRWYFPFQHKARRIYHSRLAKTEISLSPLPREKMILAVGHLAFRKGQHILVQAFEKISRQHPDWTLVLVGPESGDGCPDWIRSFCRKEGLENQVKMMGQRADAREWMKKCAIFVQPSLQEALGLALQEAMACGCACIGSNVGGIPELIRDRTCGLICNAGDPFLLAQGLESLIHHPDLRAQYGKAAVGYVKALGMTRDAMILAHREIYEGCCRI
jgi:glycosyltransferase involved in cell wall biosynthesis